MIKNLIKPALKFFKSESALALKFYKDELDRAFSSKYKLSFFSKLFTVFHLFVTIPLIGLCLIGSIAFIVYSIPWIALSALALFGILAIATSLIGKRYEKEEKDQA